MGVGMQHGLHSQLHLLDDLVLSFILSQSQVVLDDRGGDVQLDVVHGDLLELVCWVQHC